MALPPGPRAGALRQTWAWVRRPWAFLERAAGEFGTPFTMRFAGGRRFVLVSAPEHVRAVYTAPPELFRAGRANQNFRHFVGEHTLFALDGADHRRHRRLLQPPFQGERVAAHGALLCELALEEVERWRPGEPVRLEDAMHRVTLRAILHAIFGVRDEERRRLLAAAVRRMSGRAPAAMAFLPFLRRDLGPWSPYGRFLAARRAFDEVLFAEIRAARAEPAGRADVLARLVDPAEAGPDPLGDQELRDELLTLLGAGHETTTVALAWAFQWVLGLPGVLRRLREELDGELDPARLAKLPYLEAVVHETLRIAPPIPITLRELARDAPLAGHELPRGTVVCPSPYLTQRDPALYPEPERFRPERFLERRPNPFEYHPFGGGARTCLGLAFAVYEMKLLLACVLARAELRLVGAPGHASRRRGITVAPLSLIHI